jgi:hypothetical protein
VSKDRLIELAFLCFGMSVWGSLARTFADNKMTKKKGKELLLLLVANAFISSFCGMLALPLAQALHLGHLWTVSIAGLAGWMGVGFLEIAEIQVKKRMGTSDVKPGK